MALRSWCFWAQGDLAAAGREDPIYILPVALKYRFVEDMRPAIAAAAGRLEAALGLGAEAGPAADDEDELYRRIRRLGSTVVARLEQDYGLTVPEGLTLAQRMDGLKDAIVERVAAALRVQPKDDTLPDRMRFLINALYQVTDEQPTDGCRYDHRLWEDNRQRMQPLMRDLDRLANWIAVYDGYVSAHPTAERMADLIWRLEIEVLGPAPRGVVALGRGLPRLTGQRRCLVRLGEPISIGARFAAYQNDKRQAVAELTRQIEGAVQALLDEMA